MISRSPIFHNNITLGTVQFGMSYGVANQTGQIPLEEAFGIMDKAWALGVNTLDTAIAYGESEQRLGEIGVERWRVISKLPVMSEGCKDVYGWVLKSVEDSLERLKINCLSGLLLHRPQQLLMPYGEILFKAITKIKEQGMVEKIGVSIYDPNELDVLWSKYHFDMVQAPCNIVDRRLITSGWLSRLHQAGLEVQVRSIFLQGLLLMDAENRPPIFNRWQLLWGQWHRWLADQALTPLQACLGFVRSQREIAQVVVGVDSLKQLQEIFGAFESPSVLPPDALISEDVDLINPSHWSML